MVFSRVRGHGRLRSFWSRNAFARGLATVFSGTVLAQLVGLAVLPIFARMFAPDAFGHLQVYQALLTVLAIAVTARFEIALLRCEDDEAAGVVEAGALIVIMMTVGIGMILYGLNLLGLVPGVAKLPFPLGYLLLAVAATGFSNLFFYRLLRSHRFASNAVLRFSQAGIYALVGLALGLWHPTLDGLIIADLCGRLAAMAYGGFLLHRHMNVAIRLPRLGTCLAFLGRYRDLPRYALPGSLANAAGAAITPIYVFSTFGAASAGQYSLLDRTLALPVSMVVAAVSQVFAARFSEFHRNSDRDGLNLFRKLVAGSALLAVFGGLVGWLFAEELFILLFGREWAIAANLARVMLVAYAVSFVAGTVNQTLVVLGRYRLQMSWDLAWLLIFGAAWWVIIDLKLGFQQAIEIHAAIIILLQASFVAIAYRAVARALRAITAESR
jgi:O-antigen/teichoic acid export membrane protein